MGIQLGAVALESYPTNSEVIISASQDLTLSSLTPHDAIVIDGDADLIQQAANEGWPGDGSEGSPYLIQGYSFNLYTQAIRIFNTELYWEFRDNIVEGPAGSQCATWVVNTTHGAFINNEFFNRGHSALYVDDIEDLTISGNYIHDCGTHGIEAVGLATNCIIEDNIFEDNGETGINFLMGLVDSTVFNNTVVNSGVYSITVNEICEGNTFTNNTLVASGSRSVYLLSASACTISGNNITDAGSDGLRISEADGMVISENIIYDSSKSGLKLLKLTNSDILDNTIVESTEAGISIEEGSTITISENEISSNDDYGLILDEDTTRVTVEDNEFYSNGDGCQICDDGSLNEIECNYYDDWDSPDADADGYVDNPYSIDGTAANSDGFPLSVAGVIPDTTTATTSGTSSTTTEDDSLPLSPEILILGAAGIIGILVVGVLIIKKRT
jgi:parallel beta-helix repeat protein